MSDAINPNHYKTRRFECIEFTRHLNFTLGNAFKYIWRNGLKPDAPAEQDIDKAFWYMTDFATNLSTPCLSKEQAEALLRKISLMESQLSVGVYSTLCSILIAAGGDSTYLFTMVQEYENEKGNKKADA